MKQRTAFLLLLGCVGCGSSGGGSLQPDPKAELSLEATDPKDGAEDVPRNGRVWVRFSDQVSEESVKLRLQPEADLTFRYSESSGRDFTYEVTDSLARLTEYHLRVEAVSLGGAALDPPFEISFTTGIEPRPDSEQPPAVYVSPADGAAGVSLAPTLSFSFSKPMARKSVEDALHFEPAASCGALTWTNDATKLDCVVTEALPPATSFTVTLDASASSEDGVPLDEPFTSTFVTRLRPTLVSTAPADEEIVAGVDGSVALTFAPGTRMDETSLRAAFRYLSPAGHAVANASCFFEKCTITTDTPFAERQTVKWELSTDAVDDSGVAIADTATGSFKTGRRALLALPADPALDGSVTEAGSVDKSGTKLSVGRSADGAVRSLLSFDLAALPASMLAFSQATLKMNHEPVGGAPADLGYLLVYSVDYGTALDASAFDTPVHTYDSCNLLFQCSMVAFDAGLSPSAGNLWTAPVGQLVQRDLDAKAARSQMRLAFKTDAAQSSSGTETFTSANAAANRPVLEVEYWEP
jgi:Big-like domain-containing protein